MKGSGPWLSPTSTAKTAYSLYQSLPRPPFTEPETNLVANESTITSGSEAPAATISQPHMSSCIAGLQVLSSDLREVLSG